MQNKIQSVNGLLQFIKNSPTAFQAVESVARELDGRGFLALNEGEEWNLIAGENYYVTRNGSSILAFRMPPKTPRNFLIAASHTDSPMLKIKGDVLCDRTPYLRLSTEIYGGTILSTWLDRPLSLAGRAVIREGNRFVSKNIAFDRDLCLIPNLAIHQNRSVNDGIKLNPAVDMLPLLGLSGENHLGLSDLLAKELNCAPEAIVSTDLYAVCRTPASVWGANDEFFSSPRIDNLFSVYTTMMGFVEATPSPDTVTLLFAADNEEVGSATKQGAASTFLSDVLDRICEATDTDKRILLAASMMVSADNAHAKHPNHPELMDAQLAPVMGGGVVIKQNAAQKYTTDALSEALFAEICRAAGVPVQYYANRSDLAGGSTLGSISNTRVSLRTVDVGAAQLAMHSAYETASTADVDYLVRAMTAFFGATLLCECDGAYQLQTERS